VSDPGSVPTHAPEGAPAAAPKKAAFHIPSLDGLRAISWAIVFIGHTWEGSHFPGGFGVTVFFFLSGYLITTLMRMEYKKTGTVSLREFYLRRALRILPPFYLVLLVTFGFGLMGYLRPPAGLLGWSVLAQGLHVANYWMLFNPGHFLDGTGVYWSLAIEEHFYFIFPALFLFLMRRDSLRQKLPAILFGICLLTLAWRVFCTVALHRSDESVYVATDTRIDAILWGCILAVHRNPMLDENPVGRTPLWKFGLLPLGLGLILFGLAYRAPFFRQTFRYTVIDLGLYPLFAVAIASPKFWAVRWLNIRPLRFVGTLSFSLYLVHHVVVYLLGGPAEGAKQALKIGAPALGLSFALAYGMYRLIEQPCAKLRKKLASSGSPPSGSP
jgi:peptidoglycan/LPS O-acetylase OafA/YrhL